MEIGRIAVEPAQIALIDRLGVVIEGPVIASRMPLGLQAGGQAQALGDLGGVQAMIGQAQGLVVNELVEVALLGQEVPRPVLTPAGPVVAGEQDIGVLAEHG